MVKSIGAFVFGRCRVGGRFWEGPLWEAPLYIYLPFAMFLINNIRTLVQSIEGESTRAGKQNKGKK